MEVGSSSVGVQTSWKRAASAAIMLSQYESEGYLGENAEGTKQLVEAIGERSLMLA